MFVEVNTGNGMENKETLERWASDYLNETLARFNQDITRVQVQLSDENSGKGGAADKRCMLEARLNGYAPVAVNHHAATGREIRHDRIVWDCDRLPPRSRRGRPR